MESCAEPPLVIHPIGIARRRHEERGRRTACPLKRGQLCFETQSVALSTSRTGLTNVSVTRTAYPECDSPGIGRPTWRSTSA